MMVALLVITILYVIAAELTKKIFYSRTY